MGRLYMHYTTIASNCGGKCRKLEEKKNKGNIREKEEIKYTGRKVAKKKKEITQQMRGEKQQEKGEILRRGRKKQEEKGDN